MPTGVLSGYIEISSLAVGSWSTAFNMRQSQLPALFVSPRRSGRIRGMDMLLRRAEVNSGDFPESKFITIEIWKINSGANYFTAPTSGNNWTIVSTGQIMPSSLTPTSGGGAFTKLFVPLSDWDYDSAGHNDIGFSDAQIKFINGVAIKGHVYAVNCHNVASAFLGWAANNSLDTTFGNLAFNTEGRDTSTISDRSDAGFAFTGTAWPSSFFIDEAINWMDWTIDATSITRTDAGGNVMWGSPFVAVGSQITRAAANLAWDGGTHKACRAYITPITNTNGWDIPELNSAFINANGNGSSWVIGGSSGALGPTNFFTGDLNDHALPTMFVFSNAAVLSGTMYYFIIEANSYAAAANDAIQWNERAGINTNSPAYRRMLRSSGVTSIFVDSTTGNGGLAFQFEVWHKTDAASPPPAAGPALRAFPSGSILGREWPSFSFREFPRD